MSQPKTNRELRAAFVEEFRDMVIEADRAVAAARAKGEAPQYRHGFTLKVVGRVVAKHGVPWTYDDFVREWMAFRDLERAAGTWQEPTRPADPTMRGDILTWALASTASKNDISSVFRGN